ncbi:MAG: hypothetical protein Q8J87_14285 [Sediminibacterium sp.]|nr:hypothetical protein [Sediminibacterium sp.]
MKQNTKGAWIIHHSKKLQKVENTGVFDEIHATGKSGILLSALAESENNSTIEHEKVKVIAKAANINPLELPSIIQRLKSNNLIDDDSKGNVSVLGLTSSAVLKHTADMFDNQTTNKFEKISLEIAETVSHAPKDGNSLKEFVGDTYKIDSASVGDFFQQVEDIGFIDYETIDTNDEKLYFNGNLFKRDNLKKANAVLSSLSSEESNKVNELDNYLNNKGCIPLEQATKICGEKLISKLQSIGMYELNEVANNADSRVFVTKATAFGKFGNPFEDDALDLAKAFVASLSYGMIYSKTARGKIWGLKFLMNKLITGGTIGPATAIGQDYRILELKGVVKIIPAEGGMCYMRLLKKDIGLLALNVLESGDDASESSIITFPTSSVTTFKGPEFKREETRRKKQNRESKIQIIEALRTLRS